MTNSSNAQIDFTHWLLRLVAYIIDSIILVIIIAIITDLTHLGIWFMLGAWAILSLLYFIFLDVYWGTTIGKKIIGLNVQLEKGGKVPLKQSIIRNISKIFILLPILDWLIAVVTSGTDRRQKYTDRLAGTTVVQTRQVVQSTAPSISSPPPPT